MTDTLESLRERVTTLELALKLAQSDVYKDAVLDGLRTVNAEMREALTFYADPAAWKEQHDPDDTLWIPENYRLNGLGDTAKAILAKTTKI